MKLLFDQNLSFRLVDVVSGTFPGSTQVQLLGLERASDRELWEFARDNGFVIVTKDSDFHELCVLHGPPPKIIWLKAGNVSNKAISDRLVGKLEEIKAALQRDDIHFVELH